jgi:N-acetylneuraminate synthase
VTREIRINGRAIGPAHPPYVIAELSANHNGELKRALALMEAAAKAGVDAVKLQTLRPDAITIDHDGDDFIVRGSAWDGRRLFDLYREAQTPWEWHEALFAKGRELGVTVFSSPFDHKAVEFLEKLDAPAFKIASFEMVDIPLIERAARSGRPIIMSTGMGDLGQIGEAVAAVGRCPLALLHCVSAYPARPEEANLRTIPHLADAFDTVVGLSDHTLGLGVSVAAVALGASIIEKHFTLRRADGGLDSEFSLEPEEMADLTTQCRAAWAALGKVNYALEEGEKGSLVFRRSLYVVADVSAGTVITADMVRSIRPGYGLAPRHLKDVLGRKARRDLKRGSRFDWAMVE